MDVSLTASCRTPQPGDHTVCLCVVYERDRSEGGSCTEHDEKFRASRPIL
ncbi:MAG: hypothetical protein OEU26_22865 [Candidatus Tectomicrobia bacterium]|nr:hypothetical protein [Candidatus Tectomicrobia bacterium]